MKVLVVEDEQNIRDGLIEILHREGYETVAASNGEEALKHFDAESPDFICLDIMMPEMSGYDVCKAIKQRNDSVPIIFISAKSEEVDRVVGLELGADDFIVKPFGIREVVARIRAVTRRCNRQNAPRDVPESFRMKVLDIFPAELRARRDEETIDLSLRDIQILTLLYRRQGEVVTRDVLFDECWGLHHMPNSRTLDQHISQLRKRIEHDPKNPEIIQTVHGSGYRFEA